MTEVKLIHKLEEESCVFDYSKTKTIASTFVHCIENNGYGTKIGSSLFNHPYIGVGGLHFTMEAPRTNAK